MTDLPKLSDEDVAAIQAFLARYQRLYLQNQTDIKIKAEVDARLADQDDQFKKLHAAFEVFGFERGEKMFDRIYNAVGHDRYWDALERGGAERPKPIAPPLALPLDEVIEGKVEFEPEVDVDLTAELGEPLGDMPTTTSTVRDLVLSSLKAAGSNGAKAAEIRDQVERERQEKLHFKTTGMTLYRLSQDGLARREGRVWFYVPPSAEMKNPGAATPGPHKGSANSRKEE